jgi:hypothetical protein
MSQLLSMKQILIPQTLKGLESDSNRYTKIQSISSVKTLIHKGKN